MREFIFVDQWFYRILENKSFCYRRRLVCSLKIILCDRWKKSRKQAFCNGSFFKNTIIPSVFRPPKFRRSIVFSFSWGRSSIIAGLDVTSRLLFLAMLVGTELMLLCQFFEKKFFCIDPQHGRLVTWLQSKIESAGYIFRSLIYFF